VRPTCFLSLLAAIAAAGCCVSEDVIRQTWSDALLPGAEALRCEWSDGDNSAVSYKYDLPVSIEPAGAIAQIRSQITRSGASTGTPPSSCFEVVAQTATYLVMVCRDRDSRGYGAWEILLEGRTVSAIAGPPSYVLDHLRHPLAAK
jgi:hypothetical protein